MARLSLSNSIVVNAPIDACYENFNDPEIQPEWFDMDIAYRNYAPPLQVGSTFEQVATFMGREMITTVEVVEMDVPYVFGFRIEGMFKGDIQHQLKAVEGGTQVTIRGEFEPSGFFASLAAPMLKGQINKQMQNDLASFKAYMEG